MAVVGLFMIGLGVALLGVQLMPHVVGAGDTCLIRLSELPVSSNSPRGRQQITLCSSVAIGLGISQAGGTTDRNESGAHESDI